MPPEKFAAHLSRLNEQGADSFRHRGLRSTLVAVGAERAGYGPTKKAIPHRDGWLLLQVSTELGTLCRLSSSSPSEGDQADAAEAKYGEGGGFGDGIYGL